MTPTIRDAAVALFVACLFLGGVAVMRLFAPEWAAEKLDALTAVQCASAIQGCICAYGPRAAQLEGVIIGMGAALPPAPGAACGGN